MANTYIKILLHLVFAIKNRDASISPLWRDRFYAYICGILRSSENYPIAIGGTDNHIHIFFAYSGKLPLPDLVRDIKSSSSKYVNDNRLMLCRFEWQKGYACFSHSPSQADAVSKYINRQYEHHLGHTFDEEIRQMMARFGIDYDERYILTEPS